jgi:hypothetical protein
MDIPNSMGSSICRCPAAVGVTGVRIGAAAPSICMPHLAAAGCGVSMCLAFFVLLGKLYASCVDAAVQVATVVEWVPAGVVDVRVGCMQPVALRS